MLSTPIIEADVIIELGVPNEKVKEYKSSHGFNRFVQNTIINIASNLSSLGEHKVVQHYYDHDDSCEINNFRYSDTNRRKKSKTHKVFRNFGATFYVKCDIDKSDDLFGLYLYEFKKCKVEVCVCGVGTEHNQAPKAKLKPCGSIK